MSTEKKAKTAYYRHLDACRRCRRARGTLQLCDTGANLFHQEQDRYSVSTPAELTLEEAAKRDNYCPRCRMVSFNPNPVSAFCACGDEAWEDCCADQECSSCKMPFQVPASPTPPAEAADAPPERIWTVGGTLGHFFVREGKFATYEYISAAAHEKEVARLAKEGGQFAEKCFVEQSRLTAELGRLRDALRGLICPKCSRKISSPSAPEIMECPECAAARAAALNPEGSKG